MSFYFFYKSDANNQRGENNSQVISKVSVLNSLYGATIIWISKLGKGKPIMEIDRASNVCYEYCYIFTYTVP